DRRDANTVLAASVFLGRSADMGHQSVAVDPAQARKRMARARPETGTRRRLANGQSRRARRDQTHSSPGAPSIYGRTSGVQHAATRRSVQRWLAAVWRRRPRPEMGVAA